MGIGACYVLTREFFRYYTQLDASVFLYGEEALVAGQVMAVGGRTYYDNQLRVQHAVRGAVSQLPSRTAYEHGRKSLPFYKRYL